jgi:hypothetical protein
MWARFRARLFEIVPAFSNLQLDAIVALIKSANVKHFDVVFICLKLYPFIHITHLQITRFWACLNSVQSGLRPLFA